MNPSQDPGSLPTDARRRRTRVLALALFLAGAALLLMSQMGMSSLFEGGGVVFLSSGKSGGQVDVRLPGMVSVVQDAVVPVREGAQVRISSGNGAELVIIVDQLRRCGFVGDGDICLARIFLDRGIYKVVLEDGSGGTLGVGAAFDSRVTIDPVDMLVIMSFLFGAGAMMLSCFAWAWGHLWGCRERYFVLSCISLGSALLLYVSCAWAFLHVQHLVGGDLVLQPPTVHESRTTVKHSWLGPARLIVCTPPMALSTTKELEGWKIVHWNSDHGSRGNDYRAYAEVVDATLTRPDGAACFQSHIFMIGNYGSEEWKLINNGPYLPAGSSVLLRPYQSLWLHAPCLLLVLIGALLDGFLLALAWRAFRKV